MLKKKGILCAWLLGALCMMMSCANEQEMKTRVIAHRGYWTCEGSAQNSIRSLERASEIGAYGSEFDVYLTADSVLVLFHDDKIGGRHVAEMTYAELSDTILENGEPVPTLDQFLERAKSLPDIRLVYELKVHPTPERDRLAAQASVAMVEAKGLADRTDYISFSLEACKELIRLAPDAKVFYLNGELAPEELKAMGFAGLDYHFSVLEKHPEWIDACHELGMEVNVWTVDEKPKMEELIGQGVDYLTTDYPEEALSLTERAR